MRAVVGISWALSWIPVSFLSGCGARTALESLETGGGGSRSGTDQAEASGRGASASGGTNARTAVGGQAARTTRSPAAGGWTSSTWIVGGNRSFGGNRSLGGNPSVGGSRSPGGSRSSSTGGRASGGTSAGGTTSASHPPSGGTSSGGSSSGGASVGGSSAGGSSTESLCPASLYIESGCIADLIEGAHALCNDLDDDCDGSVDEGCPCTPGTVKPCFAGPPGRRGIGACRDGLQACEATADHVGRFGLCLGGISPSTEICDNLDNDCNGCRDEILGCVPAGSCPGPGDPRIPELRPFSSLELNVSDYFDGDARSVSWSIEGGPCDRVAPTGNQSFDLSNPSSDHSTFVPRLSGDYTVTLAATALSGEVFRCDWVVPVRGPGLRVEMCYPESDRCDLDLYLKRLSTPTPWFSTQSAGDPNMDTCGWHNCEATLRGNQMDPGRTDTRVDWGYPPSDLSECSNGPLGAEWTALGYCANPRLDIDNNLSQGTGLPENVNIDQPRDGDGFRVMVRNFTGTTAHPIVNVYCGGVRVATFGAPPDVVPAFTGTAARLAIGPMWRVADLVTSLDANGETTCSVTGLHPSGADSGYFVTIDDPSF